MEVDQKKRSKAKRAPFWCSYSVIKAFVKEVRSPFQLCFRVFMYFFSWSQQMP